MDVFEEGIRREYEPFREEGPSRIGFAKGFRGRQKVDPRVQAAYNLNKKLEKYPDFTKEARQNLQNEFEGYNDLPVVNLETFAAVLSFLKDYPNFTPEQFKDDTVVQYFTRLLPTKKYN
jgi:hypothetical protein